MKKVAIYPGTFDPITFGHIDVIKKALKLFDKIVVGVGSNANKTPMFTAEQRLEWIAQIYKHTNKVFGAVYDGLTIDYCKKIGANFILRERTFL